MKLEDYKAVLIAVGFIGVLLIATPALTTVVPLPRGATFSELYLLGPEHMLGNFPSNIAVGQNYSIYVGAGNHMASSTYYLIYMKFGNRTDPLPDATTGAPSPLSPLFQYRLVLEDGAVFESLMNFSIANASFSSNQSVVKAIGINGFRFDVDKQVDWDAEEQGLYYRLIAELWLYNPQSGSMEYNNRFVYLHLNLTSSAVPAQSS